MANDFLVSKWKLWYKSLDVNHDGIISLADVEASRNAFTELHHLEADKKKLVMENFGKWWNEYIFRGKEGKLSEQHFLDSLKADFEADKAKFRKNMEKCFDSLFEVIDTNKDRSISEEEFLIAFKAYGHKNVVLDTNFFKAYDPVDGLVPLKDIVNTWVDFTCSEDSSVPNVVKTALESGV